MKLRIRYKKAKKENEELRKQLEELRKPQVKNPRGAGRHKRQLPDPDILISMIEKNGATKTAQQLSISRQTLYRKLNQTPDQKV